MSTLTLRAYFVLAKPGIIFGNLVTMAAGFALASHGRWDLGLFLRTALGLSFVIASGCIFNNYIDREADKKMGRTQKRALAIQWVSEKKMLALGFLSGGVGALLLLSANVLTMCLALLGLLVYVGIYSFAKYRTVHATLIGSIAGAIPPVVGYTAVSGAIDGAALILFAMIVFWQMPHFYAIAIYRQDDYAAASIPVLPIKKGIQATKIQSILYLCGFIISSCLLSICGYTGIAFLVSAAVIGFAWLGLAMMGLKAEDDIRWARKMFIFSLIAVTGLSAVIIISQ